MKYKNKLLPTLATRTDFVLENKSQISDIIICGKLQPPNTKLKAERNTNGGSKIQTLIQTNKV